MKHYYWLIFFVLLQLLRPAAEAWAQCPVPASCTPGPASNPQAPLFGMGIFNVSLGAINNTTLGTTDGYWDYSCQQVAQLTPGATYPISISTNPNSDENVRVWLDYNNDGTFDPIAELFFSSNNARQHRGTSQPVPATAIAGVRLRLRVAADAQTSSVPSPCSTPQYSQTEDYGVLIGAPSQPPVAAFSIGAAQACMGTFTFTDQSPQGPTTWYWSFGDGTTSTQSSPVHTYAQPGTYPVKLRVCNAFGCDSSTQAAGASWYAPLAMAAQCMPATASYCCSYGITQVDFAGQIQVSADAAAGYEDFTCRRQFTAQQNQVLPLRITTGGISRYDTRVYIDYNNDGRFSETNELVFEALNVVNPSGTIRLAAGGVLNTPLRLRVLAAASGLPLTACTNLAYGQAEDYSLVLTPGPCSSVPALAALTGITTVCGGDTALLIAPNAPGGAVFQQWQTSPDSLTWTNVLGAHGDRLVLPLVTTVAYYRLVAACGTSVRASPATRVAADPNLCYCNTLVQLNMCNPFGNQLHRLRIAQTTFDYTPPPCQPTNPVTYHRVPPYPLTQTARLQRGGTYEIRVTGRAAGMWIDYNHNGQFEQSEFINAPASVSGDTTVLATVPITAALGPTGLRLRNASLSAANGGTLACDSQISGEDYDFTVTIVPPSCAAPLLSGVVLGPRTFCPGTVPAVSVLGQTIGTSLQWQTSPDGLTWANQAGAQSRLLSGAPLTDSTYVRVQVSCGPTVAYTPTIYLRPDPQQCFCVPPPMAIQCKPYLRRVSVGNTPLNSRGSVCAAPSPLSGYRYFSPDSTANTATLLRGISYPFITNRNSTAPKPFSRVWLDYNHDGHFTDDEVSNLRTDLSAPQNGDDSVATFTVPANAPLGRLRMRVLSRDYGASILTSNLCDAYGETRDYMLTIAAPDAAPGAPVAGTITGAASLCPGKRLRLTLASQSYGASLQWEALATGSTAWQPLSGATGTVLLTPFTTAASYRVAATANGSTTYSVSHAVAAGACPCTQNLHRFSSCIAPISGIALQGRDAYLVAMNRQCSIAAPQAYADYSLLSDSVHTTLRRGQDYSVGVLTQLGPGSTSAAGGLWLDYNGNGTFEPSEYVSTGAQYNVGVSFTTGFTVPATTVLGQIAMRVRTRYDLQRNFDGTLACTSFNSGETEDYMVTIAEECPLRAPHILFNGHRAELAPAQGSSVTLSAQTVFPAGTTWHWTGPNGFTSTAAQPVLSNLASAHTGYYYLTLQSGSCQLTAARYLNAGTITAATPARNAGLTATLAPNPSPGRTTLRLTAPAAQVVDLVVLNSLGQTAWQGSVRTTAATTEVPLALPQPVPGLYIVRVTTASGTIYRKWVVE